MKKIVSLALAAIMLAATLILSSCSGGELADICVLHGANGAPYYDLRENWARLAAERGVAALHLSVSHDGGMAAAVCVAEKVE